MATAIKLPLCQVPHLLLLVSPSNRAEDLSAAADKDDIRNITEGEAPAGGHNNQEDPHSKEEDNGGEEERAELVKVIKLLMKMMVDFLDKAHKTQLQGQQLPRDGEVVKMEERALDGVERVLETLKSNRLLREVLQARHQEEALLSPSQVPAPALLKGKGYHS